VGLIGSEICAYFGAGGFESWVSITALRADFFGPHGDRRWNLSRLKATLREFARYHVDIRERTTILRLVQEVVPDLIVHAAVYRRLSRGLLIQTYLADKEGTRRCAS